MVTTFPNPIPPTICTLSICLTLLPLILLPHAHFLPAPLTLPALTCLPDLPACLPSSECLPALPTHPPLLAQVELKATKVVHLGNTDPAEYPLAKKKQSMEFLREKAHLRPR